MADWKDKFKGKVDKDADKGKVPADDADDDAKAGKKVEADDDEEDDEKVEDQGE